MEESMKNASDAQLAVDDDGQLIFACAISDDKEDRYDVNTPVVFSKSNALIKRIGKTTLLSEQALLVAIYKAKMRTRESIKGTYHELYYEELRQRSGTDFSEGLIASFTSKELKDLMNIKTSRYAVEMDKLMNMNVFTNSWHILFNDNGIVTDTACIVGAMYDKRTGRVTIKFNSDIADKIINLKNTGGYTQLDSSIMRKVSKDLATWSIYQLLREEISRNEAINRKRGMPDQVEYMSEFGLAEFKFLSTVNQVDLSSSDPDQLACAKLIKEKNYEEAEQVLPKDYKMYDEWKDFRRRVLTKANKFINGWEGTGCYGPDHEEIIEYENECAKCHATDIHFRCEPVKMGVGAKINAVRLYIRWDRKGAEMLAENPRQEAENLDEDTNINLKKPKKQDKKVAFDENVFLDSVSELIEEKLKVSELKRIAEASGFDLEKIRLTYMKLKKDVDDVSCEMMIEAFSGKEEEIKAFDFEYYREKLPGFTRDELKSMVVEAEKHKPVEMKEEPGTWIEEYISYYRDKALATADETKTTMFKRLMDMLRKDYDGRAQQGEQKKGSGKTSKGKERDYKQRTYTDDEYDMMEKKKLGIKTKSK
jgi:hypothetical protein